MEKFIKYAVGVSLSAAGAFLFYSLYLVHHLFEESFVYANLAILAGDNVLNYLLPIANVISGGTLEPLSMSDSIMVILVATALLLLGIQIVNLTFHNRSLKTLLTKSYWTNMDFTLRADIKINEREYKWIDEIFIKLGLKKRVLTAEEKERRRKARIARDTARRKQQMRKLKASNQPAK